MVLSETNLKKNVLKMLKKNYPDVWVYKANDRFTSGIPDLIMCVDGKFVAIELKIKNFRATKLQSHVMSKIFLAGGMANVCRSVKEVRLFIDKIVEGGVV